MTRLTSTGFAFLGSVMLGLLGPAPGASARDLQEKASPSLLQRGEYIARAADCTACHTGTKTLPYAGGFILSTPVGKIVSTNITPSAAYGIGNWSERQFGDAVRKGIAPRGHLYPAMPYTAYARMSDADIHALYVYFMQGVKPVDRPLAETTHLPFPFTYRGLMFFWNLAFAGGTPLPADQTEAGGPRRGAYLVEVLGHCGTCHTPRNAFMGEKHSRFLGGSEVGEWHAPNITADPVSGIGGWSEEEIVAYLRTGAAAGRGQAAGPMAEAVENSLRYLSEDDLRAIASYLKSVPALRDPDQKRPAYATARAKPADLAALDRATARSADTMSDARSLDGQELYAGACAACHQLDGQGTKDQFYPSLTSNSATGGMTARNLVMVILKGVHRQTEEGNVFMPGFEAQLTDGQIASLANYVLERFGNDRLTVAPSFVTELRNDASKASFMFNTPKVVISLVVAGIIAALVLTMAIRFSRRQ